MSTELKGISIQWILAGVILSFNVIGVLCVREWIRSRRLDLYHDGNDARHHRTFSVHISGPSFVLDNPMKRLCPFKKSIRFSPFFSSTGADHGSRDTR